MRHPQQEPFANGIHATLGYSLIELAIVLLIIGLVGGTTLSVGKVQMDMAEFQGTKERLEILRDALLLFQKKYGRYPCPALPADGPADASYGQAAAGCDTACPPSGSSSHRPLQPPLLQLSSRLNPSPRAGPAAAVRQPALARRRAEVAPGGAGRKVRLKSLYVWLLIN